MTSSFGCPHCGKSNPIDARFCSYCGTHLGDVEGSQLAQQPDKEEPVDESPPEKPLPTKRRFGPPSYWSESESDPADENPAQPSTSKRSSDLRRPSLRPNLTHGRPSPPSGERPPDQPYLPRPTLPTPDLPDADDPTGWLDRFSLPIPVESSPFLDDDLQRQLREFFVAEVPLADIPPPAGQITDGEGLWRRLSSYLLLLVVLVVLLLFRENTPETLPHVWPGVGPAFATVEALPDGATVLIHWAYDPATAGEMDLVARPVIGHLLDQHANLIVVSQLSLGPPTARRLIAAAKTLTLGDAVARQTDLSLVDGGFLPGGAATLPLLGQDPALGLPLDLQGRPALTLPPLASYHQEHPALVLVLADRMEPVQRWLEQVQPLNQVAVVAVTSAATGPAVRPYLDSGQLAGLVSGYNGGIGYQELLLRPMGRAEQARLWRQIAGHNWAFVVFLIVVLAGNLPAALRRRSP